MGIKKVRQNLQPIRGKNKSGVVMLTHGFPRLPLTLCDCLVTDSLGNMIQYAFAEVGQSTYYVMM